MRLNKCCRAWLALAVAVLVAGTAVADDRNFLRQLNAPPNLIFILDTSGSMIGTPEEPLTADRPPVPFAMVPGGGEQRGCVELGTDPVGVLVEGLLGEELPLTPVYVTLDQATTQALGDDIL